MSDVFNSDCPLYVDAKPAIISCTAVVSVALAAMLSVLILAGILARKVAAQLVQSHGFATSSEYEHQDQVIVVEECNDLTKYKRQQSSLTTDHVFTLNSKDLLDFYDKLPDKEQTDSSPNLIQIPRSRRSSRHSSMCPISEEKVRLPHGSCGSLGPSFVNNLPRNSGSSAYGTVSRKTNLKRMSSQEQVNQLTRFLLLNEDVELFKERSASLRRGSETSSRKLSMDFLKSSFGPDGAAGTLKKSMASLALHSSKPPVMQRKKERKKGIISEPVVTDAESMASTTSIASDATLKAEPILKTNKYIKNNQKQRPLANADVGKSDTITYRRQRRAGVYFSQNIHIRSSSDV